MKLRLSLFAGLFVLVSVAVLLAHALHAADWPQWRGPNRDALSSEKGLNTDWRSREPELLWTADGQGQGYGSVAVAGGRIYSIGNIGQGQAVVAVDETDGTLLWSQEFTPMPRHSQEGSRSTPTVDGERLYVIGSDGTIACLKTADGALVWKRSFTSDWSGRMMSGWGYSESPLVDGDKVLCTPGGHEAMMVALDKTTGKEIWRCSLPRTGSRGGDGAGYASIVVSQAGGVRQYVTLTGRGVISARASDGQLLWGYEKVANNTANIPTPIASGNFIFCSSGYNTGSALLEIGREGRGVAAREVYFLDANKLQNHHGGMVLVGDHVYCGHGHNNGFPACVELKSGKLTWPSQRGPGSGSAAVAYYDGHVVFRYQSGDVALVEANPRQFRLKGTFKPAYVRSPSWAHPVVANGCLYLREQDKLMCYSLK